jgi:hypothetical protein
MPAPRRACALAPVVVSALVASGCSTQTLVTSLPAVVNDAPNRTLRRDLLGFGTKSICDEIQRRSVPLRLRNDDPDTGRFFIRQCSTRQMDKGDIYLQWSGVGYGWSNLTKRIGFEATAAIDYDPDFRVDDGEMYIYFRPAVTQQRQFTLRMAEEVKPSPLGPLVPIGSPQDFATFLGSGLLAHELDRGFTVVRGADGSLDFALGLVPPGTRGGAPYRRSGGSRELLANERVEVHQNQRDFAGPFEVDDTSGSLFLTLSVEGAPTIDILVYQRSQGDVWLQSYFQEAAAGPPPTPPIFDDTVNAGYLYRRNVTLPRGSYYVVLDNTSTAGRTAPPAAGADARAALVSLAVERD